VGAAFALPSFCRPVEGLQALFPNAGPGARAWLRRWRSCLCCSPMLESSLRASLVSRFVDAVMVGAALPTARRADVEEAPTFSAADGEIVWTCAITGSTYAEPWDGRLRGHPPHGRGGLQTVKRRSEAPASRDKGAVKELIPFLGAIGHERVFPPIYA